MILLFSTQDWDTSTEEVMDWIHALGGQCVRFNGEDLIGKEEYRMELSSAGCEARLSLGETVARKGEVKAVWYRRGGRFSDYTVHPALEDHEASTQIDAHLQAEMRDAAQSLYALLSDAAWLTRPSQARVNKVAALRAAVKAGFDIPATVITNSRAELQDFQRRHGRIITKAISDGTAFYLGDHRYTIYTEEVSPEEIEALPPTFLPTLVQECLEKEYELRIFYLAGACHAMAIFSQRDPQTAVDFRHYNLGKPNRSVPYRLQPELEQRIRNVMDGLGLTTGSIDLVKTPDGRMVFLEVNPVGQFGMVSKPCNYNLDRAVAEHLLALERSGREEARHA
jgi:ATP-GRASP peptide maturase of grasp-with-spasm system